MMIIIVINGLSLFQFETIAGDVTSEKSRALELAEKVISKDPLDVTKVCFMLLNMK